MKTTRRISRRSFIRRTATTACLAAVAPQIVPSSVLGADGQTAPSNRITVGFIGTGNHGVGWNLGPYLRHKDAQVVAVCDVDDGHLIRAQETVNDRYQERGLFRDEGFSRGARPQGH